ncbi:LysR substrate-binding domain-containing protein [Inquilinus sp. Marseille-Q2685]|uniref:LysR substrate-binding domain-containing protein n=1 Tax=Inquilinus sp. Marseille-Q2685 TaxID=2866581 RepID=UPI001CE466E6|nr:LysR substrate-binding domain-containing protein [Inquilinus sp. Marseille-Q2685]
MALPSLNALQAAEAVGRLGSLSRAAAALGVTPSAVSHRLRGLEQQLGLGLFERTEAGLVPTAAGRRLLPGLGEGFQRIAAAVAEATAQERGAVTVTCGLAFAAKWLVPRLVGLAARHPELEVRLVTTSRLVGFDREDIDLGIRFGRGRWPGLKAELVAPQPLIPVAAPAVAAALADPAAGPARAVALIEDEQSLFGWDAWLAAGGPAALAAHPRRRFPDASLAVEAALAGHGLWLAWPLLVEEALASGRLVRAFPDSIDAGLGYWLVSTPARWRRPEVARFRTWLTGALGG